MSSGHWVVVSGSPALPPFLPMIGPSIVLSIPHCLPPFTVLELTLVDIEEKMGFRPCQL